MPPTALSMEMPLSLRITKTLAPASPAWLRASKAMPPVIEPSPITAMWLRLSLPCRCAATAIPNAAEMEVEECPVPKESYSLSDIFGKPLIPPYERIVSN